jgi:small subunit ribosomal protein S3Ae
MAKGKNKKMGKKGRGNKKGDKHTFLKKEWHKLISPTDLKNSRQIGWTCVNKTSGTKVSTNYLRGRVGEMTAADISDNVENGDLRRKIQMYVEECKDGQCFTSFYGYDITRETLNQIIKKRSSLIEIYTDVRTSDGYIFRVFLSSVSKRAKDQLKINSFVNSSTIRLLRKKTVHELQSKVKKMTAQQFANAVVEQELEKDIKNFMKRVFPNLITLLRKVKMVRKGQMDKNAFLKNSVQRTAVATAAVEENPDAKNALSG